MNWIKGVAFGSITAATAMIIYKEMDKNKINKLVKRGKHIAKKIGVI